MRRWLDYDKSVKKLSFREQPSVEHDASRVATDVGFGNGEPAQLPFLFC